MGLENSDPVPKTVSVSINDSQLASVTLRPESTLRADLNVSANPGLAIGDTFELRGDGDGWSLLFLEIANVHGFSHGLFSFVIAPFSADRYDSAPPIATLFVFVILLVLSLPLFKFSENAALQRAQIVLGAVVLIFFCTTLVAAAISKYKVLLSVQAFWLCVAMLYSPAVSALVRQGYTYGSAATQHLLIPAIYRLPPGIPRFFVWARFKVLYVTVTLLFVVSVTGFYRSETGFTSLIGFGSQFQDQALPAVQAVPHDVLENSFGYDG